MEGAYINMKLIIGNRKSVTGNRQLGPCSLFEKTSRIFQNFKIGNRESGTGNWFLILVYITNVSKVQIGNKEPVPGSLLTITGFIQVSVF